MKIVGSKFMHVADHDLDVHYAHLLGKPFFPALKDYLHSAPSFFLVLEGLNVVDVVRKMVGITHAGKAEPGTIRGDFALSAQSTSCTLLRTKKR